MSVPLQTEPSDRNSRKPSSRRRRRLIILVGIVVLLAAIAVGAYYYWHSRFYESTNDAYVEGHPVTVSARVAGNIVRVYVQDNQHVPQGELLVEVDPNNYQIGLARAEAPLQAAQANLNAAEESLPPTREKTAAVEAAVDEALPSSCRSKSGQTFFLKSLSFFGYATTRSGDRRVVWWSWPACNYYTMLCYPSCVFYLSCLLLLMHECSDDRITNASS